MTNYMSQENHYDTEVSQKDTRDEVIFGLKGGAYDNTTHV